MFKQTVVSCLLVLFSHDAVAAPKTAPIVVPNIAIITIEDFTVEYVDAMIEKMQSLKEEKKELWIKISSNGGSVGAGLKLAQAMESYGSPVTCVADVNAFSMGFYFLQFCDLRLATNRTLLMAHKPSAQVKGDPKELRQTADVLDALTDTMIAICVNRMKVSERFIRAKLNYGDWFFSATEALKLGAIDGIIDPHDIPKDVVKVEVFTF